MLRHLDSDFKKNPMDDLINMETGVMGYKGTVVYQITGEINIELNKINVENWSRSEQISAVAELIDKRIHSNYTIFPINKIAFDLLKDENRFIKDYTTMEKLDFQRYLSLQIAKIDLPERNEDFLMKKLL